MLNKLFMDDRTSIDNVILAQENRYTFFLHNGNIILYQNNTLTEIYIVGLEKEITGHYLLPEVTKRYNYIFRFLYDGHVKFILSVFYRGYYNAKPGGDDDRQVEKTGFYNLTDKCIAQFGIPLELIESMNFQKTYRDFSKVHTQRAFEKQSKIIQETKKAYPEIKNYSDEMVLSFIESIAPNA